MTLVICDVCKQEMNVTHIGVGYYGLPMGWKEVSGRGNPQHSCGRKCHEELRARVKRELALKDAESVTAELPFGE